MKYLPFLLACLVVVLPSIVSAQPTVPGGLVPCQGADCTACSVVDLVNNIVKWLIGILMIVFAIITAYAGFGLVTSGGNPAAKTEAKQKLTNALIGLIIVLAAWILVDTLMRAILAGGNGEINGRLWTEISCDGQAPTSFGPTSVPIALPTAGSDAGQEALDMLAGKCGTAQQVAIATTPVANLCSTNTANSVISVVSGGSGGQPWTWNCGNKSCWAPSQTGGTNTNPAGNGCGLASGKVVASKPTGAALCVLPNSVTWAVQNPAEGQPYAWICGFGNSCSAKYDPSAHIILECGPAKDTETLSFPATGHCQGSPMPQLVSIDVPGTDGTFNWECRDNDTGNKVSCSAPKSVVNKCGNGYDVPNNTKVTSLPPQSTLCAVGSYVPQDVNPQNAGERYTWYCIQGGGSPVGCSATLTGNFTGPPGLPNN